MDPPEWQRTITNLSMHFLATLAEGSGYGDNGLNEQEVGNYCVLLGQTPHSRDCFQGDPVGSTV